MCCSTRVFMKIPNSSDMAWNRYVAPFSYGLWLAVVMAACTLGVCLSFTNCSQDDRKNQQSLTVIEMFFFIFGCLCQQGQNFVPLRGVFLLSKMSSKSKSKSKSKLHYDRQSVGQSVLVSGPHLGPATNFSFSLRFSLDSSGSVIL
jgi:hypothetical protein